MAAESNVDSSSEVSQSGSESLRSETGLAGAVLRGLAQGWLPGLAWLDGAGFGRSFVGADPDLVIEGDDIAQLDVYRPYLASVAAPDGLSDIDSPAPEEKSSLNWLNIFYAAEWVIFAGFAFYLWYRLARDAWERELEELEEPGDPASAL